MADPLEGLAGRDFLDIADLSALELRALLELAARIKAGAFREQPLTGKFVAMLFQKPSHRTRVSFEVGIGKLGGRAVTLGEHDVQFGLRETLGDAARVLDGYVDAIVARMHRHSDLAQLAAAAAIPVVNALTDRSHPCQVLADAMTLSEVLGGLDGRKVVYVGDGNNVSNSLIEASALLGFPLTVITPPGRAPRAEVLSRAAALAGDRPPYEITDDLAAVDGAAAVYTDVWASMGQEAEREARRLEFADYQVNGQLLERAPDAVFLHCLPAHRGEEVTDEVIDGPRSVVFLQARNRLFAQMALLAALIGPRGNNVDR
jgi:ornithine carbamoyltransferase